MGLRKCELEQQCKYLTEEQIVKGLNRPCIKKWAYIKHDKDVYTEDDEKKNPEHKEGKLKESHWHVMMQFTDGQKIENIAKWFEQEPNRIEKSKTGRYEHMLSYLIHANDTTKFQYKPEEVKANFDYIGFIQSGSSNIRLIEIMGQIVDGIIKPYNFTKYMTVTEYNRYKKAIDNAFEYRRAMLIGQERNMEVIFIHGPSGSGKTSLAKWICRNKGYSYKVSGSGNDILGEYKGQDCIILDDIRSSSMKFSDFIKMLDNNTDSDIQSRYHNKHISECKLMILTSIYSIDSFYTNVFKNDDEPVYQMKRRCKTYLEMNIYRVEAYQFDIPSGEYEYVTEYDSPVFDLVAKSIKDKRSKEQLDEFLGMESIKHITGLNLKKDEDRSPFDDIEEPDLKKLEDPIFYNLLEDDEWSPDDKLPDFAAFGI